MICMQGAKCKVCVLNEYVHVVCACRVHVLLNEYVHVVCACRVHVLLSEYVHVVCVE